MQEIFFCLMRFYWILSDHVIHFSHVLLITLLVCVNFFEQV